jgi:hypothetical protein
MGLEKDFEGSGNGIRTGFQRKWQWIISRHCPGINCKRQKKEKKLSV